MKIFELIKDELQAYDDGQVDLGGGLLFSTKKLIKRLNQYANQYYKDGKIQDGKYQYWFDITTPRINSEVKNISFSSKDVLFKSENLPDDLPLTSLCNLEWKDYASNNHVDELFNDNIEEFADWGNIVWKKTEEGYSNVDLNNFKVINQTARQTKDSPCYEEHMLSQSQMRYKMGTWEHVEDAIEKCKSKAYSNVTGGNNGSEPEKKVPYYKVIERNGEIDEETFNEIKGKKGGDKNNFFFAKIIVVGHNKEKADEKIVLYAEKFKVTDDPSTDEWPYVEAHKGKYKNRWFREGTREMLIECQTRANIIGNQMAEGLELASKTLLNTVDRKLANNILTDLDNGDIIRSEGINQINLSMPAFNQLMEDWNRNLKMADDLCNNAPVVKGEMPSQVAFGRAQLANQNANKYFDTIKEKLCLGMERVINDWLVPDFLKDLSKKEVVELSGDSKFLDAIYERVVDVWMNNNILALGPLTTEQKKAIKELKIKELKEKDGLKLGIDKDFIRAAKKRIRVIIMGENVDIARKMDTYINFIGLEKDPVRITAMITKAMALADEDISKLEKTEAPQQPLPPPQMPPQGQPQGGQPQPNQPIPQQ